MAKAKNAVCLERLVLDILKFNLPKCGLTNCELPNMTLQPNIYKSPSFEQTLGVFTLRAAILFRDRWLSLFFNDVKHCKTNRQMHIFIKKIVLDSPLSFENAEKSIVTVALALCSELILYLHHEDMKSKIKIVFESIICLIKSECKTNIEGLFEHFDDIETVIEILSSFIHSYAVPYRRQDISCTFFNLLMLPIHVNYQCFGQKPKTQNLRFLPIFLFDYACDMFDISVKEKPRKRRRLN